ncbi:hypothetical protein LDC_0595, partial [sediment metagenome]
MSMDITGGDPYLYYTRCYANSTDPALRQGWADGTNEPLNMGEAKFIEVCFKYTGDESPAVGSVSWARH